MSGDSSSGGTGERSSPGDGGGIARHVPDLLRRRFALKLGVVFAVLLVAIASTGGVIYAQTGSELRADTEQQLTTSTSLQADTAGQWIHRIEDHATFLSESPEVGTADPAEISPFFTGELDHLPDSVVGVHYVEASSGEVLASSSDGAVGTSLGERNEALAAQFGGEGGNESAGGDDHHEESSGEGSEGDHHEESEDGGSGDEHDDGGAHSEGITRIGPYDDPEVGAAAMAFVAEVPGQFERSIVVVVNLETRSRALERPATGGYTHVVDSDGRIVMSHRTDRIGEQNMGDSGVASPAVERGLAGESGYMEMEMGGETLAMGYAPVPGTDWVIMTHVPKSTAFALQQQVLDSILGLVLVSFLLLGLAGVTVGWRTTRSLEELAESANELERGNLGVEFESGRIDEIGRLYGAFGAMRDSLRERIAEAEDAREAAEAARQEAERLNDHLETKAREYQAVMAAAAEGDLTRRVDPGSDSEPMRAIGESFNEMIEALSAILAEVGRFADEVAASGEEVTATSEEIQAAADQVADSVGEIADGADRQDDQLQAVAEEMNALSTTIEEIASSADEVAGVANETAETGAEARQTAEIAIDEMETVEAEAESTVEAMAGLEQSMVRIEEVTDFISDVAEQTNVLALNASIEAARAGEAGEGFAVVAEEVKDLAEETRDAAEEIEGLIAEVRDQTDTAAAEVQETSEVIARSTAAVERTVEALEEIAGYAQETNVGIQQISDATSEQAASTNQAVSMVDDAASIAEQTATEASTAAGATQQQAASLSQMTDNAGELAGEADRLRDTLDRFELPGADAGAGAATPETAADGRGD